MWLPCSNLAVEGLGERLRHQGCVTAFESASRMPFKRKHPRLDDEEGQNDQLTGNQQRPKGVVLVGGVSCSAASLRAVRKPFKVQA